MMIMESLLCRAEPAACTEKRHSFSCFQDASDRADKLETVVVTHPVLDNFTWPGREEIAPPEESDRSDGAAEKPSDVARKLACLSRSSSLPRVQRVGLDHEIFPGDVLNIKGDATTSAMARLGSVGGFMGHVLVVLSSPRAILKESSESIEYESLWPQHASTLWCLRVVESCSQASGLHESDLLVLVDDSGQIFAIGEDDGHEVSQYERHDQVYVWNAPDELRHHNFSLEIMYEVLDDMRKCQEGWSWSTAIRAFLRSGELRRDDQQLISFCEIQDAWQAAPICTSVVVSFWQRYLERKAMLDAVDPLSLIIQFMPLKADRVLPGELLMTMLDCGWSVQEVFSSVSGDGCSGRTASF